MEHHVKHHMSLTERQRKRLAKGYIVQIKPEQLYKGTHEIHLTSEQAKKVRNAIKHGKGMRLQFDSQQQHIHGGKIHWGKIAKSIYHVAKPFIRPVLNTGVDALATMTGNPELAPLGNALVNKIGDQTGAYGITSHFRKGIKMAHNILKPHVKEIKKSVINHSKNLAHSAIEKLAPEQHKDLAHQIIDHAADHIQGGALKHFFKKLHNMAKPHIKGVIHSAVEKLAPEQHRELAHNIVNHIGEHTGAYGLKTFVKKLNTMHQKMFGGALFPAGFKM